MQNVLTHADVSLQLSVFRSLYPLGSIQVYAILKLANSTLVPIITVSTKGTTESFSSDSLATMVYK